MTRPPLRRLETTSPHFEAEFTALCERQVQVQGDVDEAVAAILRDVQERGDDAVLDATERFDGYRLEPEELIVSEAELESARAELEPADCTALAVATDRIRRFHEAGRLRPVRLEQGEELLGQEVRPLDRVGAYVPAFKAPLASTVLMTVIPARVAGVRALVMTTPGREIHPAIREAARLSGVTRVIRAGGAQAIAALAFGTERIPAVDKIVGPGSVYTQAAKRQVYGRVAIDSEAGPSEVVIIADSGASPELLAADLLAQAEHEELAPAVLLSPDAGLIDATIAALGPGLAELPRRDYAAAALRHRGAAVVTRDLDEALTLSNRYAPEHLQLVLDDAEKWLDRVEHAGAVFLGPLSPVPIGDYIAGPSHVLPTGGTARFFSPLGVEDFQKRMSVIRLGQEQLEAAGPHAVRLAELEGLHGHAHSISLRLRR